LYRVYEDMTTLCKMFCPDDLRQAMGKLRDRRASEGLQTEARAGVGKNASSGEDEEEEEEVEVEERE
jgi:hypothetical protein